LPDARCALSAPFHPCPIRDFRRGRRRYVLCGTFRRTGEPVRPGVTWRPVHGARTFLGTRERMTRSSGRNPYPRNIARLEVRWWGEMIAEECSRCEPGAARSTLPAALKRPVTCTGTPGPITRLPAPQTLEARSASHSSTPAALTPCRTLSVQAPKSCSLTVTTP